MRHGSYSVKFLRFTLILLFAFGWIFSGWPQIANFPPEIQKAFAAITLIANSDIPGTATNGTNVTLSFSAASLLEDDVVVLFGGHSATVGSAVGPVLNGVADTSYTAIASQTGGTSPNCGAWYKVMGTTPDTQVVGTSTSVGTTAAAYEVLIFRGVDTSSVLDQTSVTASNTSGQPDGATIVTQTNNAWAIVMGCSAVTDTSRGTVSGWTTKTGATANDTGVDHSISAATLEVTPAGSTAPPAWSTSWSSAAWYAITIALKPASIPTLSTSDANPVGQTSATFNGNITNTGGAGPTVRGFAWGTSNTMVGDTATTTDTVGQPFGTGAFTDSSQTLACNTTYYYRPYATNSAGMGYGAISNLFTTTACIPTVTTSDANPVGQTSATMNGNITVTGGANATVRGFAWGTDITMNGDTATTSDTTGQPFGTGAFTDSSQTLTCNTTYYARAYAENSAGKGYGGISNPFTTSACAAVYSISITPAGTIEYGFVELNTSTTTLSTSFTKTATNDGDATEKLNVKSSDATGGTGWTLASTVGTNQYKHEFSTTTGSRWDVMPDSATYVTASPSVAVSGTVGFDFRLTVPSSSDYQTKSITITVQAVAPG